MPPVCAKCGEIKAIICLEVKYNIDFNFFMSKIKICIKLYIGKEILLMLLV